METPEKTHFQSSVAINSKHITHHLESTLIQLANILRVEKGLTTADAIEEVRQFISKKHGEMVDNGTRETIDLTLKKFEEKVKTGKATELERDLYKIIKYVGL